MASLRTQVEELRDELRGDVERARPDDDFYRGATTARSVIVDRLLRILSDTREEEDRLRAAADDIYRIIGNEIGHGRGTDALEAISRRLSAVLSPQPTKED